MEKLSVVIITKNEAHNIARCLTSVAWADEIVVLDTGSTDGTTEICKNHPCCVECSEWLGFGSTKQKAVALAAHTWILSIDADEEVSPELKLHIVQILSGDTSVRKDAYRIKRQSWYINKWIRHAGWNKDFPIRLFDRNKGAFNDKSIHESVVVKGSVGTITELMYHYTYPNLATHLDKIKLYGDAIACRKTKEGKAGSVLSAVLHGVTKFIRMYVLQAGFLDGKTGLVLSINSAFGVYYKHLLLWEQSIKKR